MTNCRSCDVRVVLFGSPFNPAKWRTFAPEPVNGRTYGGADAYPRLGLRTYRYHDLVEDLMVRLGRTRGDAEAEAYDVPWFVLHRCLEADQSLPAHSTKEP